MASSLAFGFLPGGGFAVNTPREFDRSVPHSFIMLPTGRMPAIYKREAVLIPRPPAATKTAPVAPEAAPTAPKAASSAPTSVGDEVEKKGDKKNRRQRRRITPPHAPRVVGDDFVCDTTANPLKTRGARVSAPMKQKKVVAVDLASTASGRCTRAPFNPKPTGSLRRDARSKASRNCAQAANGAGRRATKKLKFQKRSTRRLTIQERKEGWKLPSNKHTATVRRPSPSQERYWESNMFSPLADLSCSQRREIDRTGTLQMPRKVSKVEKRERRADSGSPRKRDQKKRKVQPVSVCTTSVDGDLPSASPSPPRQGIITRSMARSMVPPPTFHSLSEDTGREDRASTSPSQLMHRHQFVPTVTSYMAEGNAAATPIEEMMRRLELLEAENQRLREAYAQQNVGQTSNPGQTSNAARPPHLPSMGTVTPPGPFVFNPPRGDPIGPDASPLASPVASPRRPHNINVHAQPFGADVPQQPFGANAHAQPYQMNMDPRAYFNELINDWMAQRQINLPSQVPNIYHRPYPLEIENEPFPPGFQMIDFRTFDGTEDPQHHLTLFTLKMGNYAVYHNLCLRLFGSSLKGPAFQWYLTLPAGSVKTWNEMQNLFLARFFVTKKDVTLADLSLMRQKDNESVEEFISRWQREASKCEATLTEEQRVHLCRNGIKVDLAILVNEQIATFRELANEASRKERLLSLSGKGKARDDKQKESTFRPRQRESERSKQHNSINTTEAKTSGNDRQSKKREIPEPKY